MLADGEYEKLWAWLPAYAEAAEPEMGGRHLAMMLGALSGWGRTFAATVHVRPVVGKRQLRDLFGGAPKIG